MLSLELSSSSRICDLDKLYIRSRLFIFIIPAFREWVWLAADWGWVVGRMGGWVSEGVGEWGFGFGLGV